MRRLAVTLLVVVVAASQVIAAQAPPNFIIYEAPKALPEFRFKDDAGGSHTLAEFRGKVVLLNVWATWCGPCRKEMPTLDRLQEQLSGPDFTVVALSIDRKGPEAVTKFYSET